MYVLLTTRFNYNDEFNIDSFLILRKSEWEEIVVKLESIIDTGNDAEKSIFFGVNQDIAITAREFLDNVIEQSLDTFEYDTISLLLGVNFGTLDLETVINCILYE
jgi:hypothetical protein